MEFRFVDEHDPAALRRRRLQAKRTQRWRQRQRQNIKTTNHHAESSRTAEFAEESVQSRPENSSLADTGEFEPDEISSGEIFITPSREDDDLGTIDTEPAYYDEEPVDACGAEEREDQTESGTPEVYAEMQADLLNGNTWSDL
ncbi:hypothetical protein FALBO_8308 [Fusarium albosuccineum]|uniref:Uncharacterized protein n=1 Tax=Fusarium albosuccineum TaxID=1237068 RepID=A0A8H4LBF0_9HYPO|nr:hypothetical protein FALBO_8308 [Fusarium albosuccineum]